ncbi:TPA_exp: putative COPII vesicle coat protein Sec16 [Trichophyton benhamiae CBS 112371]|uniref:Protein transport protein sec16 n=1 Tax=Arthroderma benhamiae (strain ATCC MYA-4681 / CBS 112371) TaxID=663331 RepID=D4ATN8_ARTBC|nr:COPII vesicle coat protein Sec16, putative [Trichophyton benhamiae CBS 112371]EFE33657.1 COPII vesicle coat protein Sec16, putative [Trichophyton benhamiae CBS 112371]DAA76675.1 TPA_exp: putative COPII vesicle coat protein Sec16 [Trichophyton benhamiae CBS 112371]
MSDDSSSKPSAEPDVAAALPDSQECSAPTETVPSRPPTGSDPSDDHQPSESQEVSQDTETSTSLDQPTGIPGLSDTAVNTENSELLTLLESNTQTPQQDKLEAPSVHVDDTEDVPQPTDLKVSEPNVPEVTLTEDTTSAGHNDSIQPITQSSDEQTTLLSRSNTAELLARDDIVSRTNSFPTVNSTNEPDHTTTSVPQVIDSAESQHDPNSDSSNVPPTESDVNSGGTHAAPLWNDEVDNEAEGEDFFNQVSTQTKPIYIPPEFAESRFEEGLPLVDNGDQSDDQQAEQPKQQSALDSVFSEDISTDEAGFFSSNMSQAAEPSETLPTLHRKQTSQVLDSLRMDDAFRGDESPIEPPRIPCEQMSTSEAVNGHQTSKDDATTPENLDENELAERWKAALDDDLLDDELLDDDLLDNDNAAQQEDEKPPAPPPSQRYAPNTSAYLPQSRPAPPPINPYAPHQPSSSSMMEGIAPALYGEHAQPISPVSASAESFSNQPKAGYKSPYDLPDDLQPKRRIAPRSASNISQPYQPTPDSRPSSSYSAAPLQTAPPVAPINPYAPQPQPQSQKPAGPSNFFEELPIAPRSRPSTRGRYAPLPAEAGRQAPAGSQMMTPTPQQHTEPQPQGQYGLQAPPRMDPYANVIAPAGPVATKPATQYSSRPTGKPAASGRYSPAPPLSSSAPSHSYMPNHAGITLPFQPRTSSPLAQHDSSHVRPQVHPETPREGSFGSQESAQHLSPPAAHNDFGQRNYAPMANAISSPPSSMPPPSAPVRMSPPRRSQTQSPGKRIYSQGHPSIVQDNAQRPASAHAPSGPAPASHFPLARAMTVDPHPAPAIDFIAPTDSHSLDPLERWKGAPIIKFGFGGSLITSFPKRVPLYSTGQLAPRMKPVPGEVKLRSFNEAIPESVMPAKFPGPLKSKSKKKEVITWLSNMISSFEHEDPQGLVSLTHGEYQAKVEKIMLWKVLRTLVEHDGVLRGAPDAEKSLRSILSPITPQNDQGAPTMGSMNTLYGKEEPANVSLDAIQHNLLLGEREKAIWDAVDHRLWGHAMLLSSTLNPSIWKQVVQEFIRREVRSVGENTQSLAALYEVLAGNFEESADELVPLSARAGLQMVNTRTGQGPTGNALDGLNKWQETLSLILSNSSTQDDQAILALGRLLLSYGRVEAAHICFLIARSNTNPIFGNLQDPNAYIVLIGADHKRYPFTFMADSTACLLTEVYEFATSVLTATPLHVLPHLQAFKLQHAMTLAETGHRSEAQQYCEAIGALLKTATKLSPHYNQRFFIELEELSNRLRQSPGDSTSSWMSKPSMEKVSGSMWAKFNSFVAGDDSSPDSSDPSKPHEDQGPFANIVGTPPVTHSPGGPESFGSYFPTHQQQPVAIPASNSRYAPNNQYAPFSSPDQLRGRRSLDSQRSPSRGAAARSYSQRRHSQDPSTGYENSYAPLAAGNPYSPSPAAPQPTTHSTPLPAHSPLAPVEEASSSLAPSTTSEQAPGMGVSAPRPSSFQPAYQPVNATYSPPMQESQGGYEPPSEGGYQPPSYEPPSYEPPMNEPESPESEEAEEKKPKPRKSFMDDDDDDSYTSKGAAAAAPTNGVETDRGRREREAAELVRKAAEEDAKRPPPDAKKGWFTGWFGKRDPSASGGPIRAKLGEQSSFYFDEDLKRWVNKKDPNSATSSTSALPPPPKGSAAGSRSASAEQRPPTSASVASAPDAVPIPLARQLSAQGGPNSPYGSAPPPSSLGVPGGTPPLTPSSRPGTALSHASSIDDLLSAPTSKKGGTLKGRKKGRYVDVMAKS